MSFSQNDFEKLEKLNKTADMMVSAHALLKEQYHHWSILSDVFLFSCTVLLCVIAFADQSLLVRFLGADFNVYVGIFSLIAFVYSFIAGNLDWKIKAERHKSAFEKYLELKFESAEILEQAKKGENVEIERFIKKYQTSTPMIISVPEKYFLKCKRHHKRKNAISKHLDQHPGASILLFKLKLCYLDNFKKSI